ncbi:hypothetical protein HOU25_gp42 [Corynebacterium phage Juicebox]|uniref:Uncharacterized protein n=1 Tax=Corynebacterium phage Juicebox TaxID=2301600 RepID=A0A385UD52_9CAUD|nr:hypothetical protein HOU25_gp42 [Corynebacterium phage Juicebox]AYB69471.1 hypothetical protein JUICEBOX_42 [Corynebacterium phage Juicebox]
MMASPLANRRAEDGPDKATWTSTARLLAADRVPRTYGPAQRPRHRRRIRPALWRLRRMRGDVAGVVVITACLIALLGITWLTLLAAFL